jgi:hypothetical protein
LPVLAVILGERRTPPLSFCLQLLLLLLLLSLQLFVLAVILSAAKDPDIVKLTDAVKPFSTTGPKGVPIPAALPHEWAFAWSAIRLA